MASIASRLRRRAALVRKRGSSFSSGRPSAREQPLGHRLGAGRQRDVLAVARAVDVARRLDHAAAAHARRGLAGEAVLGGLGAEHGEDRLDQREVDHLAPAARRLGGAQRGERGDRAVEPGERIGHGEGRQHRLAVGKAVHRGKARERLDQRAEAGLVPATARSAPSPRPAGSRASGCDRAAPRARAPSSRACPADSSRPGSARSRPGAAGSRARPSWRRSRQRLFLLRP